MTSFVNYAARLQRALSTADWSPVELLLSPLLDCWRERRQVFICGNGGSAANAIHLANDFLNGISKQKGVGLRVHALTADVSVMTGLANDEGYENIFSLQLAVQAQKDDLLIVLSGSGNSPNILSALENAKELGMRSFAILGFSGGKAKEIADVSIHFPVNDMQISEDLQLIVGHMLMQELHNQRDVVLSSP